MNAKEYDKRYCEIGNRYNGLQHQICSLNAANVREMLRQYAAIGVPETDHNVYFPLQELLKMFYWRWEFLSSRQPNVREARLAFWRYWEPMPPEAYEILELFRPHPDFFTAKAETAEQSLLFLPALHMDAGMLEYLWQFPEVRSPQALAKDELYHAVLTDYCCLQLPDWKELRGTQEEVLLQIERLAACAKARPPHHLRWLWEHGFEDRTALLETCSSLQQEDLTGLLDGVSSLQDLSDAAEFLAVTKPRESNPSPLVLQLPQVHPAVQIGITECCALPVDGDGRRHRWTIHTALVAHPYQDLQELLWAGRMTGAWMIFTCSCGIPECAGVTEAMLSVRFGDTIRWRVLSPVRCYASFSVREYCRTLDLALESVLHGMQQEKILKEPLPDPYRLEWEASPAAVRFLTRARQQLQKELNKSHKNAKSGFTF